MLIQPDRSDWQMDGNEGTDPNVNFVGTTDSTDLIFKTANREAARINTAGEFQVNRIVTNRIVSPDSVIYMGDNTLIFYPYSHSIHGNPYNTQVTSNNVLHLGTGLGYRTTPRGIFSLSIGHDVMTLGENGFAFGFKLRTGASAKHAMVIGTGFVASTYGSDNLQNDIENSLMIGFNSRNPTLFVSPNTSSNEFLTGAVGINTTSIPADFKFAVNGNIFTNGKLGINTSTFPSSNAYKLAVNGKIIAEEVLIKNYASWPDYVFQSGYALLPLMELKKFISENCHLPGIPPATELENEGMSTSEMIRALLKKVEELTLYTIQQQLEIDQLKSRVVETDNGKK